MEELFQQVLIPTLASGLTALTTWFFARKKMASETKASELENVEKAIEIWREMAESIEAKMKEMEAEMQSKIDRLTKEVHLYRKENQELKRVLKQRNA